MEAEASGVAAAIIEKVIAWSALGVEILGVSVIVATVIKAVITNGTIRFLFRLEDEGAYEDYKRRFGQGLLLGMDFLVAGDVVKSAAIEPTMTNLAALGLLVVIRTFLSWSILFEQRGVWPLHSKKTERTLKD